MYKNETRARNNSRKQQLNVVASDQRTHTAAQAYESLHLKSAVLLPIGQNDSVENRPYRLILYCPSQQLCQELPDPEP